ncbi:30S ribosomal protein S17 [bacterium]|nr:30S ribosomal protein S17 [bacterium]NCQ55032.1 30S ribosomal protein S17 [Candidatus Parcubacteria bacterium]NCS67076.1 30S ribosomal protein S17 [Candidatus Peregrinibacteria bacterium]NCS96022.1 30S ribosomal protein S17 [bacterium]
MITKQGVVVKISGEKTIKVQVRSYQTHPKYKKQYLRTKNFLVHDEKTEAKVGDEVSIVQARPVSKRKTWALTNIDKKA